VNIIFIEDRLPMQLIIIQLIIHHYNLIVWLSMINLTFLIRQLVVIPVFVYIIKNNLGIIGDIVKNSM